MRKNQLYICAEDGALQRLSTSEKSIREVIGRVGAETDLTDLVV